MLPSFANDTLTVLRPTTAEDAHGEGVANWATASETTVRNCSVQPGPSQEFLASRDTVSIDYTAFVPPSSDVRATDRIRYEGDTYTVVGQPLKWNSPLGSLSHLVIAMRRYTENG